MNGDERAVVMERGDNGNEAVVLIWANIVRKNQAISYEREEE